MTLELTNRLWLAGMFEDENWRPVLSDTTLYVATLKVGLRFRRVVRDSGALHSDYGSEKTRRKKSDSMLHSLILPCSQHQINRTPLLTLVAIVISLMLRTRIVSAKGIERYRKRLRYRKTSRTMAAICSRRHVPSKPSANSGRC